MTDFRKLGEEIGRLVEEKNAAYGNAFEKCEEFLRLLWPKGVSPEDYLFMLALVRIFDKQVRIATDPDYGGESPFKDIAGYGLLGWALSLDRLAPDPVSTYEESAGDDEDDEDDEEKRRTLIHYFVKDMKRRLQEDADRESIRSRVNEFLRGGEFSAEDKTAVRRRIFED